MSSKKRQWGIVIAFIVVIVIVSSVTSVYQQQQRKEEFRNQEQKRIAEDLKQYIQEVDSPDPRMLSNKIKNDLSASESNTYTEDEIIERWLKQGILDGLKSREEYEKKLGDVGIHRLLDAERIKDDVKFDESKKIIKKAKETVISERRKNIRYIKQKKNEIDSLNVSDATKREMKKGYSATIVRNIQFVQSQKELELKWIGVLEDMVNFLEEKKGTWDISEGAFVFNSSEDVKKFNSFWASIEGIEKEQQALFEKKKKKVMENADSFSR